MLPPSVIDEGIELCVRVPAGTDDHEVLEGMFGRKMIYAAKHGASPIERADGKLFNICYNPEKRFEQEKTAQAFFGT